MQNKIQIITNNTDLWLPILVSVYQGTASLSLLCKQLISQIRPVKIWEAAALDYVNTPELADQLWVESGEMENMQCC